MPDIKVRVGQQNAIKVVASSFGGSLTAENAANATNVLGGIASVTQIINSGVTTLTGPVRLGSTLDVSGISTFSSLGVSGLATTKDLLVTGIATIAGATISGGAFEQLKVTGVSTLGITSATWLEAEQLSLSGITTFNEDVKFVGNNTNMRWNHDTSDLTLWNATRLVFGDNEDFQIWHGGTHTFLKNSETGGDLRIRGDKILLKRSDDSGRYLEANKNQDVKLFYNEIEKFATTGIGVTVLGNTETQTLNVTGVSTFAGIVTTSSDLYVGGDLYISDDLVLDNITGNSLKITGLSTFTGNITAVDATFSGNVSVAGTLTHEDVTNIDSVGLITARSGVRITDGGLVVTAGVSTFGGDITASTYYVADNIRHTGDTDTYIEFNDDQIRLMAGGKGILRVQESTVDTLVVNDGGNNCDFRVEGLNDNSLIFTDGGTDKVGIGTSAPTAKLDVNGTLNVTGLSTFVGYVGLNTGLTVAGVTTFNQDVQFPGAAYNILWDQATSKFKFDDSAQLVFGTASGGDMKLFHQSGNSTIRNETGQFRIAGNDIRLQTQNHSEDYLLAVDGGSVSIFHNDVKRLETTASGVDITDTLNVAGVSTFVGVVTTSSDLYIGGDLYIKDDLTFDEFTAASGNITGILTAATANVTGTLTAGLIDGGSY